MANLKLRKNCNNQNVGCSIYKCVKDSSRNTKRRLVLNKHIVLVLLASILILVTFVIADPPTPQNVRGRVLNNDSTGAPNGIPVIITNTNISQIFSTQVYAPPVPSLAGSYSLTINGSTSDFLNALAYNATMYGTSTAFILANISTVINITLNHTRLSEANVTITYPKNNTLFNITHHFNVTINISVLIMDGTACNVTLYVSNQTVINFSSGANSTNYIGDINLTQVMNTSFELVANSRGSTNISALGSCRSDGLIILGLNFYNIKNISVVDEVPPIVNLMIPSNNTLYKLSNNISLFYNVTDDSAIANCSLLINGTINNTKSSISEGVQQNFTLVLPNGNYNWSVRCFDSAGNPRQSGAYNLNMSIPSLSVIFINVTPNILLNSGSTKNISCNATFEDSNGAGDIISASAFFYMQGFNASSFDNNASHYTDNNCTLISNTSNRSNFLCSFNVLYYANNGTWICNASVYDISGFNATNWTNTTISPIYSLNITDGIDFGQASAQTPSLNIATNLTNIGNMAINVTIQGYALVIGDKTGMNCSDGTNITIQNIRFSTNSTANFTQKNQLNGSIQPLNFQIKKQNNSTQIVNSTYWQISPDPGAVSRICAGYVIFSAEAP